MELCDYIEIGSEKAGSLTALGKMLDLSQPNMSSVKANKRALPIDAADVRWLAVSKWLMSVPISATH